MKKLLAVMVIAIMASSALALTACGGKKDEGTADNTSSVASYIRKYPTSNSKTSSTPATSAPDVSKTSNEATNTPSATDPTTVPVSSDPISSVPAPDSSEITPSESSTPSVSESLSASETPSTSSEPSVSVSTSTSETPSVSVSTSTSEIPSTSTDPASSASTSTSETPSVSTSTSETPSTSSEPASSVSTSTSSAAQSSSSVAPSSSSAPSSSTTPVVPKVTTYDFESGIAGWTTDLSASQVSFKSSMCISANLKDSSVHYFETTETFSNVTKISLNVGVGGSSGPTYKVYVGGTLVASIKTTSSNKYLVLAGDCSNLSGSIKITVEGGNSGRTAYIDNVVINCA